jgi:hypothetical protein
MNDILFLGLTVLFLLLSLGLVKALESLREDKP